ncbi:hypothetical protein [Psychrobacter sp. PAMC 21119]|uniref:hypothetical protein n=1 Tax=Psychrobacter sp. PAMC 21119 TaxID=1112209 RepID=UPI000287F726|nr:hypothetical protein [Psychrobacter sp. PAMC 21119]
MSDKRPITLTAKEHCIKEGTLYINGQIVGKASLTISVFEVDENEHNTQREQRLVGQSLIDSET